MGEHLVAANHPLGFPVGSAFQFEPSDLGLTGSAAVSFLDRGFALLLRGEGGQGGDDARLVVSDGEGVTTLAVLVMPAWRRNDRQVTLVASPDGTQLLIAYPGFDRPNAKREIGGLRVDCAKEP